MKYQLTPILTFLLTNNLGNAKKQEFFQTAFSQTMMNVLPEQTDNIKISPIFTVGETLPSSSNPDGYTPPGILDGMGAFLLDEDTVRLFTNHELRRPQGYNYTLCGDVDCTEENQYSMTGARLSFYDFDIETKLIKDSGLAYTHVYESDGTLATSSEVVFHQGFARFCSAQFVDKDEYGNGRGIGSMIQFGPEETGLGGDLIGGSFWALDVENFDFWKVSSLGKGAWESITQIDTNTEDYVAFVMPDDTSPRNIDEDEDVEAAPLYLYVGEKDRSEEADFLGKNGLRGGKIYVWAPNDQNKNSPLTFKDTGNIQSGHWVEINNTVDLSQASIDGSTLYDQEGYPTQTNLWLQAKEAGAFKFSRPEDISTYSRTGNEFVLVSTGVGSFDGVDSFGTIYVMEVLFSSDGVPEPSDLKIFIDADADLNRTLRSPDNLDWADDGFIYIQEDRTASTTPQGEDLFGENAANKNEAQLVRINSSSTDGIVTKLAVINRSVIIDASADDPFAATDLDAGSPARWESSGIIDVGTLFGKKPGSLFIFNIQAHGIELQESNPGSRILVGDLVEGGQLLFLETIEKEKQEDTDDGGGVDSAVGGIFGGLVLLLLAAFFACTGKNVEENKTVALQKIQIKE
eukprot:snap_masked-scaffold_1-processed-gene-13.24-mRNA-1 protein AED:1.00 eAED:1.00 QI:0/-1/0/0/-1/1/1/0/629